MSSVCCQKMFRGFDDDPFFRDFGQNMRQNHGDMFGGRMGSDMLGGSLFRDMDNMMNNMMRGFNSDMGMIDGPRSRELERSDRAGRSDRADRQVSRPFNRYFPDMSGLSRQMDDMARDGNAHTFSSHQVYSYCNDGSGEPKEFQAISSTATAPGGVKETKKGYKDSTSKTQKMQYGRHLGERATIQERSQIRDEREEKTDYLGFTEEQAPDFDREWGSKASTLYRPTFGSGSARNRDREIERPRHGKQRALPDSKRNEKQKTLPEPKKE